MIGFFKTRQGNILFGDYATAPSENTYNLLSEIPNNSYGVLTETQITRYNENQNDLKYIIEGVETPQPIKTLKQLKADKLQELDTAYKNNIDSGFTFVLNENEKIIIKKADSDIDLFNKQLSGYRLLEDLQQTPSSVSFLDINGKVIELNYNTYKQMLGAYFVHNQTLYFAYKTYAGQISIAENETQLNDINFIF